MTQYFYEDKGNRRYVWERRLDFKENGGYYLIVEYKPKNLLWKILHKIGLIRAQEPIAEIEHSPMHWEYIEINFAKSNLKGLGIFCTHEGIKAFRMTIPNETVHKYEVKVFFKKLYN